MGGRPRPLVIISVGALRAIRVRPLKVNVRSHSESDANHGVAGLEEVAAAS
jgi:hypothetical protein